MTTVGVFIRKTPPSGMTFEVFAVNQQGTVLSVYTHILTHGYALKLAADMAKEHSLPVTDCSNGNVCQPDDWQSLVYRMND